MRRSIFAKSCLYRLETATILISPSCFRVHCNSGTSINLSASGFAQDRSKHDSSAAGQRDQSAPLQFKQRFAAANLFKVAVGGSPLQPLAHAATTGRVRDNDGSFSTVALIRAIISRSNSWPAYPHATLI